MSTGLHRAAVADSLASLQAAAGATANGTALDVKGWDGVLFQVTGSSPVGTITFEGSADDGTTWVSIEAYNIADGTVATTTTAVGDFVAVCSGLSNVRARLTFTSGTWTVGARAFPGAAAASLVGSSATSGGTSNVNVAKINNVTPLMGAGNTGTGSARVTIATDQAAVPVSSTTLSTAAKQPALGTAGTASADVITVQGIASATPVQVALQPQTANGSSIYRNLDVGVTGVRIKSGAGQVYGYYISNNAATARFVKLYDSNSNPPTSAETPVLTLQLPASSAANVAYPNGITFASGIGIRASNAVADNDATATTTNDVVVNLLYK